VWNSSPGALLTLPHFSDTLHHYPFYYDVLGAEPDSQFTAVIYSQLGGPAVSTSPLHRLIRNVARSLYVARVSTALLCHKYHAEGTLLFMFVGPCIIMITEE